MKTPSIVGIQEWQAERGRLLVKEKELTRARCARRVQVSDAGEAAFRKKDQE